MPRRLAAPALGHALADPPVAEWPLLAERNQQLAATWDFEVNGRPVSGLRELARREAIESAERFSEKLRIPVQDGDASLRASGLVVMTGHQPDLIHPGVWIKDFLLQRLAEETGAAALDLVVDSDGFDAISAAVPCLAPEVRRCAADLVAAQPGACYATTPTPTAPEVDSFCERVAALLAALPATSPRENFSAYAACLRSAVDNADNVAELLTIARRRYEDAEHTRYGEVAVTSLAHTSAFSAFVADVAHSAERFADAYNAELADYRKATKTRSAAQPFPDLARRAGRIELPFWVIHHGVRLPVWAEPLGGGGVRLSSAEGEWELELEGASPASAALSASEWLLVPKALALTLFVRVFCCDLFIHGIGGGRYDAVTDGVCRRYFGVEPPASVVASLSMMLPIEFPHPEEAEVSAARERLHRVTQNPDAFLHEADFDSPLLQQQAEALAAEKTDLLGRIGDAGADKKALGRRIREINEGLGELMQPLTARLSEELAALERAREDWAVVSDRTYPFCYWSPAEIAREAARV